MRILVKAIQRREFLTASSVLIGAAVAGSTTRTVYGADPRRYDNLRTDDFLGEVELLAEVDDPEVFTEGPAVDRQGRVFFTNVAASKILVWDPKTRQVAVFRENSNQANGLCFDRQGRLLACEGGAKRVTRTDMKTGQIEVLASEYHGFPLAAPNDLCTDAQGRIYFTSRPGVADPSMGNVNAVYRIDPSEEGKHTLHQILAWPEIHMPNGIGITDDQRTLYLIESHPEADHHRDIRAYDLHSGGSLRNGRVLFNFYPGRGGDGMCLDKYGYLYVAAGLHKTRGTSETLDTKPGIHVISAVGQLVAFRETPTDTITNCTFGGPDLRTLYITCGRQLLSIHTKNPGKPSYRPAG